jgi:hypothetical protein
LAMFSCSFPRLLPRDQVLHPAQDCLSCYTQFLHDFTVPNFRYIVLVNYILGIDYIIKMQSISVNKSLILAHSLRRVNKNALISFVMSGSPPSVCPHRTTHEPPKSFS